MSETRRIDCRGGESLESMESWLEKPTPQTPLEYLQLEREVTAASERQADLILHQHLLRAHDDEAFVRRAGGAARERHPQRLRHRGQRPTWVLMPGGTRCLVWMPYWPGAAMKGPQTPQARTDGRGVYPVLEALVSTTG